MTARVSSILDSAARVVAVALIVALLASGALWYALQRGTQRSITAYFTSTVGLYVDNTVNVQGIPVGTVDDIVPVGNLVRVVLKVDNDIRVPADAQAVIIAPTLVSDRYVQLGPSYTGGPVMPDGAIIPADRTAVPVELDAVYKSLNTIATALGPNGANQVGALNQLLRSSSSFLGGNGEALKQTIVQVAGAVGTLSDNRGNLFATVDNLQQFTSTLAANDGNVRALNFQLQDISAFLASERGNLSQVLALLPPALEQVAAFVRDNRDILRVDVGQLAQITDILVRQQRALTELADVAPLGLGNLTNVYNASSGTLDVRPILAPTLALPALDPRALLCGLLSPVLTQAPVTSTPLGAAGNVVCGALLDPGSLQTALAPFAALSTAIANANGLAAQTALANAARQLPVAANIPAQAPGVDAPGAGLLGLGSTLGGNP